MVIAEEKHGLSTDMRDRSWIWKNPDWFSFHDISQGFLSQAHDLDESEKMLEELCSYSGFENERLRVFAGNILASWNLEDIRLSRKSVRSFLETRR